MATITETEITKRQPWWVGLIFFVIGAGIVGGGVIGGIGAAENGWVLYVVGAFFAGIGLLATVWVEDLRIDLVSRTWTYRRGFRWSATDDSGDFSALEGLAFKRERRSGGKNSSSYTVWVVYLQWKTDKGYPDLNLHEDRSEITGHQALENMGERMGLRMVDLTGPEPREFSAEEADITLKERARRARESGEGGVTDLAAAASPPPGAKTLVDVGLEGLHLTLPRGSGVKAGCFLIFFALFWNGIVWFMLLMMLFGGDEVPWFAFLFMVPFVAIGAAVALGALYVFIAQQHIEVSPDRVLTYVMFLGRPWQRKEIAAAHIEEVKVSTGDSGERSVTVRSDDDIIHVGGRLSPTEMDWLAELVEQVVSA